MKKIHLPKQFCRQAYQYLAFNLIQFYYSCVYIILIIKINRKYTQ